MAKFGGLGGVTGGRPKNPEDLFERAIEAQLGERMQVDRKFAERVWGALSNTTWSHRGGDTASYSFRSAGDLVAAIVGQGTDYMDFYCNSRDGVIGEDIAKPMAAVGWTGTELP